MRAAETKRERPPSVCVVAAGEPPDLSNQTLQDYELLVNVAEEQVQSLSSAPCFFWIAGGGRLRPQTLEECVWALQSADWVSWKDTGDAPPPSIAASAGPLGVSRAMFAAPEPKPPGELRRLPWRCRSGLSLGGTALALPLARPAAAAPRPPPDDSDLPAGEETPSAETWVKRPQWSAGRLIPLHVKDRINRAAGRAVFDLSSYLETHPDAALVAGGLVERVVYTTRPPEAGKARIGLITPQLGVRGAETVLLELARQIDRERWEVVLIATASRDRRLLPDWLDAADYVYDLARLTPKDQIAGAIYSMALNWGLDVIVLQNALPAYGALPAIRQKLPGVKVADMLHAIDDDWEFFAATLDVAESLDRRIVISEAARERLLQMEAPEDAVRLVPYGVDLRRFDPARYDAAAIRREWGAPRRLAIVAFVGGLERVKRPLLLPDVAREIERLDGGRDVVFVVAGDGPEQEPLISRIGAIGMEHRFRLLGHVDEPEEVFAGADLLISLSEAGGVPLAMLEALAMQTPVVACRSAAMEEPLPEDCGVLVEPGRDEAFRLAETIVEMLGDRERLRTMGEAGRRYVERHHALDAARAGYAGVLAELAPDAAGRPAC